MRRMAWLFVLGTALSCAPPSNAWEQLSSEHLDALDEVKWADPATAAAALALCLERAAGPFGEGETEAVLCREVYAARIADNVDLAQCLAGIELSRLDEDPAVMAQSCRTNPVAEIQRRDYAECLDAAEESRYDSDPWEAFARGQTLDQPPDDVAERRALCDEAREWRLRADSVRRARSTAHS